MSAAYAAGTLTMPANQTPTLPRAVVPMLLTAAALFAALFAGRAVQPALNRPLTTIRVDGQLSHLRPADIVLAADLAPHMHVFDPDLVSVRERIEQLPWIAHARVTRVWPQTLAIRIWERMPFARWGEHGLLDETGVAFDPPAADLQPATIQALPQLSGPPAREIEVMNAFRGLRDALAGSRFVPAALSLDPRGDWQMVTTQGITLRLGDGDPLAHDDLLMGAIDRTLAPDLEQVAYIDLRYTNGFSVGWKNGLAPTSANSKIRKSVALPATAEESKHE